VSRAIAPGVTRPGGVIVELGLGGEITLPMNLPGTKETGTKETGLHGTFRSHEEFARAVDFLASGALDVAPLLTEVIPLAEAVRAFGLAADKSRAMKVQLAL
jgi:L-idonate 5-dehydrogenase